MPLDPIRMTGDLPRRDCAPPAQIKVAKAEFGTVQPKFTSAPPPVPDSRRAEAPPFEAPPRDPLYMELENVEPGATIEILVANDPRVTWNDEDLIRVVCKVDNMFTGAKQQLSLTEETAAKLGIQPGDAFEIRQVDANGNASIPTRVYLRNDGSREDFAALDAKSLGDVTVSTRDSYKYDAAVPNSVHRPTRNTTADYYAYGYIEFGIYSHNPYHLESRTSSAYLFERARDTRDPVVHPDGFELHQDDAQTGTATMRGKLAIERKASVVVENATTGKSFSCVADEDGNFELPVEAKYDDIIKVKVMDRSGRYQMFDPFAFRPQGTPSP